MSNDLDRLLDAEQERLAHLPTDRLPVLTGAVQTRLSWARTVAGFDALPAVYHDTLRQILAGRPLPYAVLTPTYAGFMRREKERLVFNLDEQLYLIERDGSRLLPTIYRWSDLNYVEMGVILLKAWLRLSGLANSGALTSTTLKFNAVTDRLFWPLLEPLRAAVDPVPNIDRQAELQKFDYLTTLNFKFRNYARRSVRTDARAIDSLLQAEMRRPMVKLWGRAWTRLVSTAHLLVLTDAELILIRDDDDSPAWQAGVRYGGVWTYIPLTKITQLTLRSPADQPLALTIELPHGDCIQTLFAREQQPAVERFVHQVLEWAPEAAWQHMDR
jgi:hypothetical protein